ncbi:MAG: BatA and WFA domain-containing protein [Bacteroidetes bacterium]|nr:BatA and WFA domain-containing protein [Bacteroidota bacterium]MDA1335325.1 BatA and WFA domain-containing protein [Bacteroidota bacterium]
MEFVHPEILWGLGALAIPIAIHLLHFRKFRRVRFSQVAFLKNVQRETKATQKIKHWWILLLRLLAFAALIFAFAQPQYYPEGTSRSISNEGYAVSIYIDNSLSMEGMGEEGQLFQSAQNKASIVVEQFDPTDQFQILTNEFTGRDQTFLTKEQALERIETIKIQPQTKSLDRVLDRIENQLNKAPNRNRSAYLFSDLQQSTHLLPAEVSEPDTSINWFFIPELSEDAPNIWIDSIWFDEPMRIQNRPASLHVKISHNSKNAVDGIPMSLEIQDQRIAVGTFNLVPGIATDTVLRYTHGEAGIQSASVIIEDAPIRFDDAWHFGYEVIDKIRIALLTSKPRSAVSQSIQRIFSSADGLYELEMRSAWSPGDFAEQHMVILSEWPSMGSGFSNALADFVDRGGTVFIIPNEDSIDPTLFAALNLQGGGPWIDGPDRVEKLQTEHPFFHKMFAKVPERMNLPEISRIWNRKLAFSEEILAKTERGKPFLTRSPFGAGKIFTLNSEASGAYTNIIEHALWVPLVLRMAEQSAANEIHQGTIGAMPSWNLNKDITEPASLSLIGPETWLPETRQIGAELRVNLEGLSLQSGHYQLVQNENPLACLGLNQDRKESNHLAFTTDEMTAQWADKGWKEFQWILATGSAIPQIIQQMEQGLPLWKICVIFGLLALFIETILLRKWKQSSRASS